jgi:integrase/recombinase XerD
MARPASIVLINPLYQQQSRTFLSHLILLGHSPEGAATKTRSLNEFLSHMEQKGVREPAAITAAHLTDYYGWLSSRPNKKTSGTLSLKTCHHHMRSIELFFIMLQSKGELEINPTATLKFPYPEQTENPRKVLTQAEIKELYRHCKGYQERAILSLAYGCGLRVSELVAVNIEDIKLREAILIVPSGKFAKRRVVPLSAGVIKELSDYFYQVRIQAETTEARAFILHTKAGRMKKYTYNKILKGIIDRTANKTIKEKEITIHNLRHSIATHLIEQKMPLEQVRMFLGHSQLETTEVYTHISQSQLKEMMTEE